MAWGTDPYHVDTLCNYGALLKTVHGEYKTAKQMYEVGFEKNI
jgi:hypothetical protein